LTKLKFRNLKINKLSPIEQWRFLNMFFFNNWKKSNACRCRNSYALKSYEARCLKKSFRGSNFVQKFGRSWKNGVNEILRNYNFLFLFEWISNDSIGGSYTTKGGAMSRRQSHPWRIFSTKTVSMRFLMLGEIGLWLRTNPIKFTIF